MLSISKIIWKKISSIVQDQVEPLLLCRALLPSFIQNQCTLFRVPHSTMPSLQTGQVLNGCPIRKTKFLNIAYLCFDPLDKCPVLSTYYGEFSKLNYSYTSNVTNKAEHVTWHLKTFTKLACS